MHPLKSQGLKGGVLQLKGHALVIGSHGGIARGHSNFALCFSAPPKEKAIKGTVAKWEGKARATQLLHFGAAFLSFFLGV